MQRSLEPICPIRLAQPCLIIPIINTKSNETIYLTIHIEWESNETSVVVVVGAKIDRSIFFSSSAGIRIKWDGLRMCSGQESVWKISVSVMRSVRAKLRHIWMIVYMNQMPVNVTLQERSVSMNSLIVHIKNIFVLNKLPYFGILYLKSLLCNNF